MFFGFNNDSTLYNYIVAGRIILNTRSKDDKLFIKSCQLSRVYISLSLLTWPHLYHSMPHIGGWYSLPGAEARGELGTVPRVTLLLSDPSIVP